MTAHQEPVFWINENELIQYTLLYAESRSADMDSLAKVHQRAKAIEQTIRSRPHNPAPRPPCEECIYQARSAEHDVQVATKAREDVLDLFSALLQKKTFFNGNTWCVSNSDINEIFESLRGGTERKAVVTYAMELQAKYGNCAIVGSGADLIKPKKAILQKEGLEYVEKIL